MKGIENTYTQHIGSMNRYRYSPLFPLQLTEGARDVAESENCYWLFDVIGSYIPKLNKTQETFFIATLQSEPAEGLPDRFVFRIQDDLPANKVYAEQVIEFSDFPKEGIRLYVSRELHGMYLAFLPSEY